MPDIAAVKQLTTKPGYQTSEFWVMLLPWAFMLLNQSKVIDIPETEFGNLAESIGSFIVTAFYLYSRTKVKAAAADMVSAQMNAQSAQSVLTTQIVASGGTAPAPATEPAKCLTCGQVLPPK